MTQIGRYRVVSELGRGAMGIVYRAEDPAIGRTVAIKTIRLSEITQPKERIRLRDRLFREARSAGILSHPGIVTIYDIQEDQEMAYVFMEFVDGPTLDKALSDLSLHKQRLLTLLRQTAIALDYAHSKGIVHRDIKPANIMIDAVAGAKITDFGVAKIVSQQATQAGMILGTPSYMAPEQIEDRAVDGRTDEWALAIVAYEMLTGERPFVAESLPGLLFKVVREEVPPLRRLNPTLNAQVQSVMAKALSKAPGERFETCGAFVEALEKALALSPEWQPMTQGAMGAMPTVAGTAETMNAAGLPVEDRVVGPAETPALPAAEWRPLRAAETPALRGAEAHVPPGGEARGLPATEARALPESAHAPPDSEARGLPAAIAPAPPGSDARVLPAAGGPAVLPSEARDLPAAGASALPASEALVLPAAGAPLPASEAPVLPAAGAPLPASEAPVRPASEAHAVPPSEAPARPASEARAIPAASHKPPAGEVRGLPAAPALPVAEPRGLPEAEAPPLPAVDWRPLTAAEAPALPAGQPRGLPADAAPVPALDAPAIPPRKSGIRPWMAFLAGLLAVTAGIYGFRLFLAWPTQSQAPAQAPAPTPTPPAATDKPSAFGDPQATPTPPSVPTPEAAPTSEQVPQPGRTPPPPTRPTPTKPPSTERFTVRIATTPPGSAIQLDNSPSLACKSPCDMSLAGGRHTLSATLTGYRKRLMIFEVPTQSEILLYLERATGTLMVRSDPPGATIGLNGQLRSEKTPAMLTLSAGPYKLTVTKEGYKDFQQEIEIRDGAVNNIDVSWK